MYEHWSDEALVERFRETRDERAFRALYERHKTGLYRYLLRTLRNPGTTEELFQETWAKLVDAALRGLYVAQESASFKTYLYTIGNHCLIDFYRRPKLRIVGPEHTGDEDDHSDAALLQHPDNPAFQPEHQLAQRRLLSLYLEALHSLPDKQREAYVLQEDGGLSIQEIAQVMGVGSETAKSYLRYARTKLRERLGDALRDFKREAP